MQLMLHILAGIVALATIIPLSKSARWWVRVLDFPRLQFLLLAVIVLMLASLFGEGQTRLIVSAVSLACLAYHAYWIYPYSPLAKTEVEPAPSGSQQSSISLLTANVLMTNRSATGMIDIVRRERPDVLLTLESDIWWEQQLSELEEYYPHTVKCPLDNLYGMHVYSRLPLHGSKIEYLIEDEIPSIHTEIELSNGKKVRAHFVHPYPPVPEYSDSSIERDAELVVIAKSLQDCTEPTLVAGDLNDVAWSETTKLFRKISGLLDPRVGRGMYNTFNAKHWLLRWPLDHLFHSGHFALKDIRRLEKFGSDHFAYLTELVYVREEPAEDSGSTASTADEEFADTKLEDQEVDVDDVPFNETEK